MKHLYAYGILVLLLGGSGLYTKNLLEVNAEQQVEISVLTKSLLVAEEAVNRNNLDISKLQKDNAELELEKTRNAEKTLKDISRVENIALRKARAYEKLVNKDYRSVQKQWEEIAK